MCPTCGQEVTSDEAHEHVNKVTIERYARYDQTYTCLVSGNAVGTDTHPRGAGCDCQVCRLVEENIQLRVELDRPEPSPTWAELDNLQTDHEELRDALEALRSDILDAADTDVAWEKVAIAMQWKERDEGTNADPGRNQATR